MEEIKQKRPGLKDYSRINYRLVQEWQVPNWVKVQPISQDEENQAAEQVQKKKKKKKDNDKDDKFDKVKK